MRPQIGFWVPSNRVVLLTNRLLVLLQDVIRGGAERAAGASPNNAIRLVGPLLQNLCLTAGDNEEICFCLAAWLALPEDLRQGHHPSREAALQVCDTSST